MKLKQKLAREAAKISYTAQGQADISYGFLEGWEACIQWCMKNARAYVDELDGEALVEYDSITEGRTVEA